MWRIAMTWNWELHGDGSEPVVTIRNKHSLTGYFKVPRVPRVPRVPKVPGFWLMTYSHMLRPPQSPRLPQTTLGSVRDSAATLEALTPRRAAKKWSKSTSTVAFWVNSSQSSRRSSGAKVPEIYWDLGSGRPGCFGLISGVSGLKRRRNRDFMRSPSPWYGVLQWHQSVQKWRMGKMIKTDI